MKKIFRMQYEECLGGCYEYDIIFMEELKKISTRNEFKILLNDLQYIHDNICGDSRVGITIDYDDDIFIGGFIYPEGSHAFVAEGLSVLFNKFRKIIDLYKIKYDIKVNKEICNRGLADDIIPFTLTQMELLSSELR